MVVELGFAHASRFRAGVVSFAQNGIVRIERLYEVVDVEYRLEYSGRAVRYDLELFLFYDLL